MILSFQAPLMDSRNSLRDSITFPYNSDLEWIIMLLDWRALSKASAAAEYSGGIGVVVLQPMVAQPMMKNRAKNNDGMKRM